MLPLKVKKLTDTAILPTRGSAGAAGFDLYADSVENPYSKVQFDNGKTLVRCCSGTSIKVHTGIAMEIPKGYVGLLFARSGLSCKQGLRPANCVGVIDEDYRGEIILQLYSDPDFANLEFASSDDPITPENITEQLAEFTLHDRVAQIVFVKYDAFDILEVDELSDTARGANGFGSTGK